VGVGQPDALLDLPQGEVLVLAGPPEDVPEGRLGLACGLR
jgi:hypothetical protein